MPKYRNLEERIIANSVAEWNPELQSYCWIWIAAKNNGHHQPYGRITTRVNGKVKCHLAHRFAYEVFKGEKIPEGLEIDHICERGLCVAPDHLQAVTRKTNLEFRYYRGKLIR